MKKIIILASILTLSFGAGVIAQDTESNDAKESLRRVEFGFRFMPTLSAFDMQRDSGGTFKGELTLGLGVGAMIGFNFTRHFGVQGELIYNSLSQKYKDQGLDRKINVKYVNIPILFSMNTGKSRPINLNAVVGPQLGFNIGSSITSGGDNNTDTVTYVLATKKSDFGFAYGAGLEFLLNKDETLRLDLGFRGVYGFANISSNEGSTNNSVFIFDRAKVRTYSGYLGITFLF